jgi:CHAT domain-containing protein/tetratricopeptide (TPR) repeat protein
MLHENFGPQFLISDESLQKLQEKAVQFYYDGEYAAALSALDEAIGLVEKGDGGWKNRIIFLTTKVEGLLVIGETEQAEKVADQALRLAESAVVPSYALLAKACMDKAHVLVVRGNLPEARSFAGRANELHVRHLGTNNLAYANCLHLQTAILATEWKTAEALSPVHQAAQIIRDLVGEDSYLYSVNLWLRALVLLGGGYYTAALPLCEQSRARLEKTVGSGHYVLTYVKNQQADLYGVLGRYDQARLLIEQNLLTFERTLGSDTPSVASALHSLGCLHFRCGDYFEAERLFRRCVTIREKNLAKESPGYASAVNSLAVSLIAVGREEKVSDLFSHACFRLKTGGGEPGSELATLFLNWGIHDFQHGSFLSAGRRFVDCLKIREKVYGPNHPDIAGVFAALACLELRLGNTEEAREWSTQSLSIAKRFFGDDHPTVLHELETLADIEFAEEHYREAGEQYSKIVEAKLSALEVESPSLQHTLEKVARSRFLAGALPEAVSTMATALSSQRDYLAAQFSATDMGDSLRFGGALYYRSEMLHSLCALREPTRPFSGRITGATRLALDKAILEEVDAVQAKLDAEPDTTTEKWREERRTLQMELQFLSEARLDRVQRDRRRRELQTKCHELERKLAGRVSLAARVTQGRKIVLDDIAASMPQHCALLDFIRYRRYDFAAKTDRWKEQRYAAYLTFPLAKTTTNLVVDRVDLGDAAPIDEVVELLCRRMGAGQYRARDVEPALRRLSMLVFAPLAPQLTKVSHLIVCPDGELSRVPFEMLPVPSDGTNRWLVEEKAISYVSSGREVARMAARATAEQPKVGGSKSVVFGNPDFDLKLQDGALEKGSNGVLLAAARSEPSGTSLLHRSAVLSRSFTGFRFQPLPGSGKEAQALAGLLGKDCALHLGADAREAELKKVVSPRVLHIATHGFSLSDQEFKFTNSLQDERLGFGPRWNSTLPEKGDWENPLIRCGLALAGANHATKITNAVAEDGLLTGLEASLLNLQGTKLVILSACESGSGEVKTGEGVMSLRRAFTIAGAESVLASHWMVSDQATGQLMTEFMRRWRVGVPRAQAWREAQLSFLRSDGTWAHPYFWAAFTLTGEWR